jgi:hypothetical protein
MDPEEISSLTQSTASRCSYLRRININWKLGVWSTYAKQHNNITARTCMLAPPPSPPSQTHEGKWDGARSKERQKRKSLADGRNLIYAVTRNIQIVDAIC